MKKIIISLITVMGLFVLTNAQVSDNFVLTQNDVTIYINDEYDVINIAENTFTDEIGNPQLPIKIISYVLPYNSTVSGIDVSVTQQKLDGNYFIYPAQPPRRLDGSEPPPFVEPNQAVYGSSTPYPNKTVEIISDGYTHGYHVVTVAIYPIVYHPANGEIYLRNISFSINYSGTFDNRLSIPFERQSQRRAELGKQFVQSMVKNFQDVENCRNKNAQIVCNFRNQNGTDTTRGGSTAEIDMLIPDYIIITNNALKPKFQILADWKTKKGVPAFIKTIEEIEPNYQGSDLQEKIRNYLKEAYTKYGASLFVLLGGDVNIVPCRLYDNTIFATDLYYATVGGTWNTNNNDKFGEGSDGTDYNYAFFLGRAPVKDIAQANVFINKVLSYEKYTSLGNSTYVNNFLALVGFLDYNTCDSVYACSFSNEIKNISFPANIQKHYQFDNYNCSLPLSTFANPTPHPPYGSYAAYHNPYQDYYLGYQYKYCGKDYVPFSGNYNCSSGSEELNKANAMLRLNSGLNNGASNGMFHLVYHLQHSGVKGMGISRIENKSFTNSDFDNLTNLNNGNYHQILFSNGCEPASFNFDCIGKHYVNNPNGGGVAFIGSSDAAGYGEHIQFQRFCQALYNKNNNSSDGYHLGIAFQKAPDVNLDQRRRLTLLGDPEMPVWTATPQTNLVTGYSIGTPNVNGNVNISLVLNTSLSAGKKATVCIKKGDECYAVYEVTSTGTVAAHNFTITPHTSGTVDVTVTAQNYIPYEINYNLTIDRNVYISDLTFIDGGTPNSIGNGDGQLDAGETIELNIQLKNVSATNATNVIGVLTCNSPYIKIINNTSTFGTISAGGTQNSLSKYVFKIDSLAPEILLNELNQIKFTLNIIPTINGTIYSYYDKFNIEIFNPDLKQGNKRIVSGNIAPGATVTMNIDLFNLGKATATGITAVLSANSSYITSCSATPRTYQPIGKYETKTNTSVYQFSISSSYTLGQPLNFNLLVTNQYGKTWNFTFNLLDKPAPIAISTINFISDRTSIKLFWTPIQPLASIQGYNIYRSDADANGNEVGNYVKLNSIVFPAAFYNDTGLGELTKYWYKISAVSSSGNESELSAPFLAWTSYPFMDSFPVEMETSIGTGIKSGINVADVNNDGKKEIFTTITKSSDVGYIIGLKPDGTELFDIDGNPTTFSGFAKINGDIQGTPAIGDLSANGVQKIISITRKVNLPGNEFYCHSSQDGNNDGKPDLLWSAGSGQSYRSPIIANLDNSSNGFLESVFFSEYGGIKIYNPDGSLKHNIASVGSAYGAIAVADIDGNGKKEIIGCYSTSSPAVSGIYIWKDDGTAYGNQPFYSLSGYSFISSVIVCDLDNDGVKEILTVAYSNQSTGRIIAIKPNGTVVNGWNNPNSSQTLTIDNNWHTVEIAVGDLNNDGKLEVVVFGKNGIYVWNNSGVLIKFIPLDLGDNGKRTPILADLDGDPEVEILVPYSNLIDAYKMNGKRVLGFPLQVEEEVPGNVCVDDIDNDGKNELIAGSGNKIYAWKINGSPDGIEWGCERANPQNTGEYSKPVCTDIIINSTTTWSTPHKSCGNIIIQPGVTLNIKNTVLYMGDNRIITIKPGAKLVVDGGKITNACPDKIWQGIQLSGNANKTQTPQNQGVLELKNGAVIENARNAIATYDLTASGDVNWGTTGGIIYASNVTFKNNRRSVEFMEYPAPGNPIFQNVSYFSNCNFIVDDNNLFASSNSGLTNQLSMWAVNGVKIKGCTFENNITNMPDRRSAIYTLESGYTVDEFCFSYDNIYPCPPCLKSTPSNFKGFETAIESSCSQKQYALTIDHSEFKDNIVGVKVAGKSSFQVSRLDMTFSPVPGRYPAGIYLDQCTDYKVEENTINTKGIASSSGIWVNRAGTDENKIYRNTIKNAEYGIKVTGMDLLQESAQQVAQRSFPTTGLQFMCNYLRGDNTNDIYVGTGGRIRYLQGSLTEGADNLFTKPPIVYNFYLDPQHYTPIIYYCFPGLEPINKTNNVALLSSTEKNPCKSTLCNNTIVVYDKAVGKSLQPYLEEYRALNRKCDEMMYDFYAKGYDKVLSNYFAGIIENEELLKEANTYMESILHITESMADLSHDALFYLKTDSMIDLSQIRDWYNEINTLSAKYSLAETYEQLGKFEEGFKTLDLIPKMFNLNEDEKIEHNNYVSLFAFKNKIRESGRTIAALNKDEIEQMVNFAKSSRGLSSVMAQGILCFFYDICLEINDHEGEIPPKGAVSDNENKSILSIQNSKIENITIHPNPTTGELIIENGGLKISNIEIFDIYGRKTGVKFPSNSLEGWAQSGRDGKEGREPNADRVSVDISHLQAGIYFVKITTDKGEVVKKIVKE